MLAVLMAVMLQCPEGCVPVDTVPWATAMGKWTPARPTECAQALHDAYSAVGPDGKRYPVWHPPVHPSGCHFGHEHGDSADVLFGYVNEQAINGPHWHRHEDHVGHKITVARGVVFQPQRATVPTTPVTCDVMVKIHQGTHSPDAFANNLHEQVTSLRCDNGFAFDLQLLSAIGKAGTLTKQCSPQTVITTYPAVPEDSPIASNPLNPGRSMGHRFLPTAACVEVARPNVFEVWKTQNVIVGPDGRQAARFAWYWNVGNPSRYWANGLKRTIDQCWRVVNGAFQTISNPCLTVRSQAAGVPFAWDDERSPFTGTQRSIRFNDFAITHPDGPTVFYTDVLGANASLTPFPGSVRQVVQNGSHNPYAFTGTNVGRDYTAPGVRAPN